MPSKRKKGGLSRLLCGCFKSETTSAKYDIAEPAPIERANHITEILGKLQLHNSIGGTTLDCTIWLLVDIYKSATFGCGFDHIRV